MRQIILAGVLMATLVSRAAPGLAQAPIPSPPTGLTGSLQDDYAVALDWANTQGATSYQVSYRHFHLAEWATLPATGITVTMTGSQATVSGLPYPLNYYFRVRASNSQRSSEWSSKVLVTPAPITSADRCTIEDPPESLVLFDKYCSAGGIGIVGSAAVSDFAIKLAWKQVMNILAAHPGVHQRMAQAGVHHQIDAAAEPPRSPSYNSPARHGRSPEQNLLCYPESVPLNYSYLVHEFGHAFYHEGLSEVERKQVDTFYGLAVQQGLWEDKYARTSTGEYWAEVVEAYFSAFTGGINFNHEQMAEHDSRAYNFLLRFFPADGWMVGCPRSSDAPPPPAKPPAPVKLQATAITRTSVTLTWEVPAAAMDNVQRYGIVRSDNDGKSWWVDETVLAHQTTLTIRNLEPGHSYLFAIKAANGYRETRGPWKAVRTLPSTPQLTGDTPVTRDEHGGRLVGAYTAPDLDAATITWSLAGVDAGAFVIGDGGLLNFRVAPDYESPADANRDNVYFLTVQAGDDSQTISLAVTVTVTNVDEPGVLSLSSAEPQVGSPLTATLSDPDGVQSTTWTWERSTSRSGPWADVTGAFDRTTTSVYTPVTGDFGYYLRATAAYTDGHGPNKSEVAVSTNSVLAAPVVNNPPAFTETNPTRSIAENAQADALVGGRVTATDPDQGNTVRYEFALPVPTLFTIDGGSGQIRVKTAETLDYETAPSHIVTVKALDSSNASDTVQVTIEVTDVNEPPMVRRSSGTGPFSIVENSGTDVGRFVATDPEGRVVTWSRATTGDHGRFEIDANGALSFKELPDYESSDIGSDKAYTVTVRATEEDDGDTQTLELTGRLAVTVAITNVNERPVVRRRSGTGPFSIVENSGTDVGRFVATDPEGQGVTWSLATSGDHDRFEIDEANGALSFKELPDFESDDLGIDEAYNVTVRATEVDDGDTQTLELTGRLAVTVAVTDVNEPPTVTGNATPSVDENTTAVATYSATDPEEVPPSWSLQGGAGVFMITSAGALAFTTAPNYEVKSSYTVTVLASDGTNNVDVDVTVTVTDVDEDEELLLSARRPFIGIGYTAAFEVGKGDAVQSPMWVWARSMSLSGPWADITVAATAATYVPVGADRDHYLRVTVSYHDGHAARTLQATSEFPTLPDSGTNEPPVFPTPLFAGGATGLAVDENATAGTVVGLAPQATDPELGTLDYSLAVSGVVTPPFEINATSRQIRVADGAVLDHEARDTYSVTVTAEDEYNATGTATFDITIEDVNERPVAVFDIPPATDEDTATTFAVLGNDIDQDDGDTLTVSITSQPSRGRVVADTTTQLVTYTPAENDHGTYTFMYTASDGTLSSRPALVTVTVDPVNDAPAFAAAPAERTVSEQAKAGDDVGAALTATDVDGDTLTYGLTDAAASDFEIDEQTGQITVAEGAALNVALSPYTVTVTADDRQGETAMVEVTITVTAGPPIIITGGGGGGGGGGGPTPSEVDFEWTVDRDIEQLDGGNDRTTGVWSDGTTLWVADNADGAGDAVYAYNRESGERVEEREFALHETNRAPRGIWSDRSVVWVSDSGRERLFAYDLATGERLEEREFALADRNSDARGIWSDEETMWVLDGRTDALFAYALASGEVLAEYALDSANSDPRGIWSDGVTIWVSDHGAKRLFAYRLPVLPDAEADSGEEDADDDARELERVREEEFTELSKASNNSPRGIWSDGDVMYVADESDDRVYSYNMPDAIDARLASLSLSGVDIGEFSSSNTEYEGVVSEGVTETTVEAEAMQRRAAVVTDPPDADVEADGHHVALQDLGEITVTVTSQDGSRTRVYRVQFPDTGWDPARDAWPHCLRGEVSEGFSLVVYEGGSVDELVSCAESRGIVALYAPHEGVYVSHILGAPDFVNREFREIFADGLPLMVPLVAASNGPPSADPFGDLEDGGQQPWPECLRGDIAAGFSLVVYEGGSVDELEACAAKHGRHRPLCPERG